MRHFSVLIFIGLLAMASCSEADKSVDEINGVPAIVQEIGRSQEFKELKQAGVDLLPILAQMDESLIQKSEQITSDLGEGYDTVTDVYCDASLWEGHSILKAYNSIMCRYMSAEAAVQSAFPEYDRVRGEYGEALAHICRETHGVATYNPITSK